MKKYRYLLILLALIICTGCVKFSFKINGITDDEPSTIIDYDPVDGTPVPVKPEPVEPGKKITKVANNYCKNVNYYIKK